MNFFFDIYDWAMISQLLTVSFSVVWVFRHFEPKTKVVLGALFHVVIVFLLGTLLNYGLFSLANDVTILQGINFPLSWLITVILYISFFSDIPVTNRVIMGATLFVSIVTMTELGHYGSMLIANKLGTGVFTIPCYVMQDVLIIAFAVFIKKFSLSRYTEIPSISAVLIIINTVVMSMVVFINTRFMISGINDNKELYCVILLAEYIMVITGYLMVWFHCKVRREKTELEVENRLLESDRMTLMVTEKAVEEMRCLRHDIKNQYLIMKMLIEDGKYRELDEYFSSMNLNELITGGIKFIDCGNELLNSIINMEVMKASSKGVDFTVKINVADDINIEKSDLCRVLVNLIDNAIEAVERNNAYGNPVDCKISKNKEYLYICVRNSLGDVADKKVLELVTSKHDTELHGYGHRIVDKLVNKYQGYIKYSIENGEFVAEAMLGSQKAADA